MYVYVLQGGYDSVNRLRQYQRGVLDETVGLNGQGGGTVTAPITLPNTDNLRTYNLGNQGQSTIFAFENVYQILEDTIR